MLKQSNSSSHILKHCEILKALQIKYKDDEIVQNWALKGIQAQLFKLVTLDDTAIEVILGHANTLGYDEFKALYVFESAFHQLSY